MRDKINLLWERLLFVEDDETNEIDLWWNFDISFIVEQIKSIKMNMNTYRLKKLTVYYFQWQKNSYTF